MVTLKIAGEQTGMVIAVRPALRTCGLTQSFCPIVPPIIDRRDQIRDGDDRGDFQPLLKSREESRIGDYDIGVQERALLTRMVQRQLCLSVSRPIAIRAEDVKLDSLGR